MLYFIRRRKMKKRKALPFLALTIGLLLILSGCGDSNTNGKGMDDEPEITVSYLTEEYSKQLIRDGATHHFGSLVITKDNKGIYSVRIQSKKLVESDNYDNGYYIADRNLSVTVPCNPEARITYIKSDGSQPEVISVDQLAEYTASDSNGEKLYDIYEIGGSIELILAKKLK